MKQATSYIIAGVVAYLLFLVISVPADRVYGLIQNQVPAVSLYNLSGSVWSGRAQAAKVNNNVFQAVRWVISPWAFFLARLNVGWEFDNGTMRGRGSTAIGLGKEIHFSEVTGTLSAADIRAFVPRLPVQLDGTIAMSLDSARFDSESHRLTEVAGTITWDKAAMKGFPGEQMGNFRGEFSTAPDGIVGTISDTGSGALELKGNVLLKPDNSYKFTATLGPRDRNREDLLQALKFVGRAQPDGKVLVEYSGKL